MFFRGGTFCFLGGCSLTLFVASLCFLVRGVLLDVF